MTGARAAWSPPSGACDVVLAGFGGQGILLAGRLLANAALRSGLNALVYNYYEGFVRGGVSECTVVLSQTDIESPVRRRPAVVAALDARSLATWAGRVRPGGLLIVNTSVIEPGPAPEAATLLEIPAGAMAAAAGNPMCVSLVVVGTLIPLLQAFSLEDCLAVLTESVPSHRRALLAVNEAALRSGAEFTAGAAQKPGGRETKGAVAGDIHGAH